MDIAKMYLLLLFSILKITWIATRWQQVTCMIMTVVWYQKSPECLQNDMILLIIFFKSAVAPVRVRPAQKTQHARTSHAQFYWGFAPVRTPDSARTRATARTHARTLKLC